MRCSAAAAVAARGSIFSLAALTAACSTGASSSMALLLVPPEGDDVLREDGTLLAVVGADGGAPRPSRAIKCCPIQPIRSAICIFCGAIDTACDSSVCRELSEPGPWPPPPRPPPPPPAPFVLLGTLE